MKSKKSILNRRTFVRSSLLGTSGLLAATACLGQTESSTPTESELEPATSLSATTSTTDPEKTSLTELNLVGPKVGYTPHMGALVSMMNWMRDTVLYSVKDLSTKDLDYLHDDDSNSIGGMLLHLGATERFYQLNTFDGHRWGNWPKEDDDMWSIPMGLGNRGRKNIKGHNIDYYLEKLESVRAHTLEKFKTLDDDWLMAVDPNWVWRGATNNYCKWFHVCEHESNHNGQIKYIKSRIS